MIALLLTILGVAMGLVVFCWIGFGAVWLARRLVSSPVKSPEGGHE